MGEQSPIAVENAEKSSFEKSVMNDFYLSFKFSQQSDRDLHGRLMAYTAREYSTDEIRNILENKSRFEQLAGGLTLPSQHGKVPNPDRETINLREGIKRQFLGQWVRQCDIFAAALEERTADTPPRYSYHQVTGSENHLLASITYEMLKKDASYVEDGRPNRPEQAKYESYLRTYGIEGKPTGSEIYDGLFVKLKGILQNPPGDFVFDIGEKVSTLAQKWETNHPDQSFFPI